MPTKEGEEPLTAPTSSIPPPREEDEMSQSKEGKGFRATLEQWQATIDERIRTVLPNFAAFRDLEQEVKRLSERLESLERNLPKPPENRE
jgi:hypothetical protein